MLADMQATNNDSASRIIRNFTMDGTITASLAGNPLVIAYPEAVAVSGHPTYSLPSHTSHTWTGLSGDDTETASYDSSWSSFNNFIGTGSVVDLTMDAASYITWSADTGVTPSSDASAGSELIVTYEYYVVPEPSSVLFLGLGGLVFLFLRGFRKAKS
jgi:hypothetical protein